MEASPRQRKSSSQPEWDWDWDAASLDDPPPLSVSEAAASHATLSVESLSQAATREMHRRLRSCTVAESRPAHPLHPPPPDLHSCWWSPLRRAVYADDLATVYRLMTPPSEQQQQPAQSQAKSDNPGVAKDAIVVVQDPGDAASLVLLAARQGSAALLSLLLLLLPAPAPKRGGALDVALAIAARLGRPSVCAVLIAHGASPGGVDAIGRTPLEHALASGCLATVLLMLRSGCEFSAEPKLLSELRPPELPLALRDWSSHHLTACAAAVTAAYAPVRPVSGLRYLLTEHRPDAGPVLVDTDRTVVDLRLDAAEESPPNLVLVLASCLVGYTGGPEPLVTLWPCVAFAELNNAGVDALAPEPAAPGVHQLLGLRPGGNLLRVALTLDRPRMPVCRYMLAAFQLQLD